MSLLKWLVIQFRQMFPPSNHKTILAEVGGDGGGKGEGVVGVCVTGSMTEF